MNASKEAVVSLYSVFRELFHAEWDSASQPPELTDQERQHLERWRGGSTLLLPVLPGSPWQMPSSWVAAVAMAKEDISDAWLTRALRIAAFGYLRGSAPRPPACSQTAAPLGANAALCVLQDVIGFGVSKSSAKTAVSQATLDVWDDYDRTVKPPLRRAPKLTTRKRWAREARLARFGDWLRNVRAMDSAATRRAELDADRILTKLGLSPTTETVDKWLVGQEQARRLRWAWQLYAAHCAEVGDIELPGHATPGRQGRPSLADRPLPPAEVCGAIQVLARKFSAAGLRGLRVSDYETGLIWRATSRGRTPVPLSADESQAVQVVRTWAANSGEAALVPTDSCETGAMSLAGLKRVLAHRVA